MPLDIGSLGCDDEYTIKTLSSFTEYEKDNYKEWD